MTHRPRWPRGLYAITPGPRPDLLDACAAALAGGAVALQYRDKTTDADRRRAEATALVRLCTAHGAPLIINDDVELAAEVGAAGVHVGEHDAALADARARLGPGTLIGVSCYDSLAQARAAARGGADYVAFGAFHPSTTKPYAEDATSVAPDRARHATPDLLDAARPLGLPLVAIGGITPDNGATLLAAGADNLAVISALFGAPDISAAARRFARLFDAHH